MDVSRYIAGPFCGSLLADLGADVTYVEPPGAAPRRAYPPHHQDGTSSFFTFYNRGKRSITLDFSHPDGLELLLRMCEKSDVLVHNIPPERVRRLGLDFKAIHERVPRLVVVAISAFGQRGPYSHRLGVDGVAQAMGGLVSLNGEEGEPPLVMGAPLVDSATGIVAALGTVSALFARSHSDSKQGCLVDANLLETAVSLTSTYGLESASFRIGHERVGSRDRAGAPATVFPTKDGSVYLSAEFDAVWKRFAALLGFDMDGEHANWATLAGRMAEVDALEAAVSHWTSVRTTAEVEQQLTEASIPVGRVRSVDEVVACPHLRARNFYRPISEGQRTSHYATVPLQFDHHRPGTATGWPSPGESNDHWYRDELGLDELHRKDLVRQGVI